MYSGSMANEVLCFPYLGFVQRFSRVRVTQGMVMSVGPRWTEIDQDRQRQTDGDGPRWTETDQDRPSEIMPIEERLNDNFCISRVKICTSGKGFICDKNGRDFKFTSR